MVAATLRFIAQSALPGWLEALSTRMAVFAPQRREGVVTFNHFDPALELALDGDAVSPPKHVVFPQTKALVRFATRVAPSAPHDRLVDLREDVDTSPALVFGTRPCGVKGFTTYDQVFVSERVTDPYYKARRDNTVFFTMACEHPHRGCFCNLVGGAPDDTEGSDVLLTPVTGGFTAQAVTAKSEALLAESPFEKGEKYAKEAKAVQAKAKEALGPVADLSKLPEALRGLFNNLDFWDDMAAGCIGCGACTFLCPTCYCFNITDETDGIAGARVRTWDACMFAQYSMEASGHNPRPTKAHRLRNRIGHKFWYHPANHGGTISCCGCGRCTKYCPGVIDLRHILQEALKHHGG